MSRAAARLQDDGSVGQLLVECSGKNAFPGFGDETFSQVEVVIVRKGRLLIKCLNHLRDVMVRHSCIERCEKSGNALFNRVKPAPAGADPAVLGRNKRLTSNRTHQDLCAVPKSGQPGRRALLG